MPLQQSITDQSGVTTTYWVINSIHADMKGQTVSVTLVGYLNAAAYTAGNTPSARRPFFFSLPFSAIPSAASGSISLAEVYTAVLANINNPSRASPSPLAGATLVS